MNDLKFLQGIRNVAVFGASGAIGRAMIEALLAYENIQLIHGFSRSKSVFDDARVSSFLIDYQDEASILKARQDVESVQSYDLIFIATGALHVDSMMPEKSISEFNIEKAQHFYLLNTIGPGLVIKHFSNLLNRQNQSILAALCARIGSIGDNRLGGWYSYRLSKAGLAMLMKSASIEIRRRNKHAVCVCLHPGTVESKLSDPFRKNINPKSIVKPEDSANNLLRVIANLQLADTGKHFAYDGNLIPY